VLGPTLGAADTSKCTNGLGKVTTNECPMELRIDYKLIRVGGGQTVLPYK